MSVREPTTANRATNSGGYWDFVRNGRGEDRVRTEIWAYVGYGSDIEKAMREQEIHDMLERATLGTLLHREKGEITGGDVAAMSRAPGVFELIWNQVGGFAGEERPVLFRLYFAEPPEVDELLLGLFFSKKRVKPKREITTMQNEDIDEAGARYKAWRGSRKA
jgi:hypothetical protein